MALLMLNTVFMDIFSLQRQEAVYALSSQASALLPTAEASFAQSLVIDSKTQTYEYNKDYQPGVGVSGDAAQARFSASFAQDPTKGVTILDPISKVSLSLTPKFKLESPVRDQNRLVYPVRGSSAQHVYSLQAVKVKEDIILNNYQGDTQEFSYELGLGNDTEAMVEPNGSIGVYGVDSSLLGDVTTGTDNDAKLLEKARQNAPKTNLLFTIPAPFVKETGKTNTKACAWYGLKGNILTIHATGLKNASYPLTIDPSVYIESAANLMRGNNSKRLLHGKTFTGGLQQPLDTPF